jgi:hypothetical protein
MGIKVSRKRGGRCKQLLDGLKENRGYCKLKEKAIDRTLWKSGIGYGPVVIQTTGRVNEMLN